MSQTTASQHLESIIRTLFEEGRFGNFYLVDLKVTPARQISVYVDGDQAVSLEDCTRISRELEPVLDAEPTLEGVYTLEVSSPGVSRPLKFPRQYTKHIGRTMKIDLVSGGHVEGVLKEVGPEQVMIEIKPLEKKGVPDEKLIRFDEMKEAVVTVQFGQKKKK
jgi:ribosome maturation factor RimP